MADWRKRKWMNAFLLLLIALSVFCLVQLGNWQIRRLEWKTQLINAVDTRAYADAEDAPRLRQWNSVSFDSHAYMRVHAEGTLLNKHELIVRALTELGSGYWVLTPLKRDNGEIIWINRGFVPPDKRFPDSRNEPEFEDVTVTGLLRITEPGGTVLQANDPEAGRWYSRDVDAFSENQGLPYPAPYFIDVERSETAGEWPRGGLTKVKFRNNHLQYALTWYAMAILLAGATVYVVWLARRP